MYTNPQIHTTTTNPICSAYLINSFLKPTVISRFMVPNMRKERMHSVAKSVGNVLRVGAACIIIRKFTKVMRNLISVMIVVNHLAICPSYLNIKRERVIMGNGHINVTTVIKHIQILLHY